MERHLWIDKFIALSCLMVVVEYKLLQCNKTIASNVQRSITHKIPIQDLVDFLTYKY